MSLLKEMPLNSGSITINGKISYASQEAWSFNGSARDNILFGCDFDENKYRRVVHVCALERDFKLFMYGDKTLVGERGVSLSRGQRARITLAIAVYRDADVYLLDDPLSAVDPSVAKHIFDKCISGYLKRKVCILVTHQIQFLKKASKILVLNEGKCIALGSYDELVNSGLDVLSIIGHEKEVTENTPNESEIKSRSRTYSNLSVRSNRSRSLMRNMSRISDLNASECVDEDEFEPAIEDEEKESGSINAKLYWIYFRSGAGPIFLLTVIFSTIISQAIFHASDLFLAEW